MNPVDPAELSAYLDRELSSARMQEVEAALEHDVALRAELEVLKATHLGWQAAARSVMFTPQISLPESCSFLQSRLVIACTLFVLVVLRFAPKFTDVLVFAVFLHAVALLAILPWLVLMVQRDSRESFSEPGGRPGS